MCENLGIEALNEFVSERHRLPSRQALMALFFGALAHAEVVFVNLRNLTMQMSFAAERPSGQKNEKNEVGEVE